jgi:hypothetical protein
MEEQLYAQFVELTVKIVSVQQTVVVVMAPTSDIWPLQILAFVWMDILMMEPILFVAVTIFVLIKRMHRNVFNLFAK